MLALKHQISKSILCIKSPPAAINRRRVCELSSRRTKGLDLSNYPHFDQSPVTHSVHPPTRMSLFWHTGHLSFSISHSSQGYIQ